GPRETDADAARELRVEDDEIARPLTGDQHAVARGRDRNAVGRAAEAQVDGAAHAPQVRLVEAPEGVVLLPGGEDVGRVERERARVLSDGALVRERARRRAGGEAGDAVRGGIDHEAGAPGCARAWRARRAPRGAGSARDVVVWWCTACPLNAKRKQPGPPGPLAPSPPLPALGSPAAPRYTGATPGRGAVCGRPPRPAWGRVRPRRRLDRRGDDHVDP